MARVARALLWCDRRGSVDALFATLRDGLGFAARREPAESAEGLLGGQAYRAAVSDGATELEMVCFPWVERAREARGLPPAALMLAVGLGGVAPESLQAPQGVQAAMFMQPLALVRAPALHPLLVRDDGGQEATLEVLGTTAAGVHVKELAFGEQTARFYATAELLGNLAAHRAAPGVLSFGDAAVPYVRVLPSRVSTVTIKVPQVAAAVARLQEQAGVACEAVGATGAARADVRVVAPFLHGLDLRLSDSEEVQARFVEAPSTADDTSVQFARTDMGSMSCRSVTGMEVKARALRLPERWLGELAERFRPEYRV